MLPIPSTPESGNDNRKRREEKVRTWPISETVKVLRGRDSFVVKILRGVDGSEEARPCRYLATTEAFIALPDEVTSEWVREIAEGIADEFALWQAGCRQ
jgi:hypothetical protein